MSTVALLCLLLNRGHLRLHFILHPRRQAVHEVSADAWHVLCVHPYLGLDTIKGVDTAHVRKQLAIVLEPLACPLALFEQHAAIIATAELGMHKVPAFE